MDEAVYEYARKLDDARSRIAELEDRLMEATHVIAEEAGSRIDWHCRCDICRKVAMAMDAAGYGSSIDDADAWWRKGGGQ